MPYGEEAGYYHCKIEPFSEGAVIRTIKKGGKMLRVAVRGGKGMTMLLPKNKYNKEAAAAYCKKKGGTLG